MADEKVSATQARMPRRERQRSRRTTPAAPSTGDCSAWRSSIVLSLIWYLLADRYTPFTSQARIEGFVVGVAPQVAGTVTRMMVTNNQEVEQGQPLFEVDPSQYRIALDKARSDLENAGRQVGAGSAGVAAARANLIAARANEDKTRQGGDAARSAVQGGSRHDFGAPPGSREGELGPGEGAGDGR